MWTQDFPLKCLLQHMRCQAIVRDGTTKPLIRETEVSWLIKCISTTQNTTSKFFFMIEENLTSCSVHSFGYSFKGKESHVGNINPIIYSLWSSKPLSWQNSRLNQNRIQVFIWFMNCNRYLIQCSDQLMFSTISLDFFPSNSYLQRLTTYL